MTHQGTAPPASGVTVTTTSAVVGDSEDDACESATARLRDET
jgi:hypothetical protein